MSDETERTATEIGYAVIEDVTCTWFREHHMDEALEKAGVTFVRVAEVKALQVEHERETSSTDRVARATIRLYRRG